jgi:hypothetical protein
MKPADPLVLLALGARLLAPRAKRRVAPVELMSNIQFDFSRRTIITGTVLPVDGGIAI